MNKGGSVFGWFRRRDLCKGNRATSVGKHAPFHAFACRCCCSQKRSGRVCCTQKNPESYRRTVSSEPRRVSSPIETRFLCISFCPRPCVLHCVAVCDHAKSHKAPSVFDRNVGGAWQGPPSTQLFGLVQTTSWHHPLHHVLIPMMINIRVCPLSIWASYGRETPKGTTGIPADCPSGGGLSLTLISEMPTLHNVC